MAGRRKIKYPDKWARNHGQCGVAGRRRHSTRRGLAVERLEPRQMLSLTSLVPEAVVNTHTDGLQQTFSQSRAPAVAVDDDGDMVAVWADEDRDGSGFGVYGRRFDSSGAGLGEEFQVNLTTFGPQSFPAVAMDSDGDFVVTWSSLFQDGSDYGVYARRYNAAGEPQGGEFRVNQHISANQNFSTIAMRKDGAASGDGDFVIAWTSNGQDGDATGVYARCFDHSGTASGPEFLVNTATQSNQRHPTVSMDAGGGFLIAWTSQDQDGSGGGIFAQRRAADATPLGNEFPVNTTTLGNQQFPCIDMDASGAVVAWQSFDADGDTWRIFARRFDAEGIAAGGEIFVGDGKHASVTKGPGNDFVVAWEADDGTGKTEILARHFGPGDQAWGATVCLADEDAGNQSGVSAAGTGSRLIVVHTEEESGGADGADVIATRFDIVAGETLNEPPQIDGIDGQTADECAEMTLATSAVDPDGDVSELTYSLAGNPPGGAAIDPVSGLFTWTPSESQGPGVYSISIRVIDNGSPPLSDVTSFWITVEEVNLSPQVAPIGPQTTDQGEAISVNITATDADLPANGLVFSLADDAPDGPDYGGPVSDGAAIDPSSGSFTWTPSDDFLPGDYDTTVTATDDGEPSLADSQTLTIRVEPALLQSIADQTVVEGETLAVTALPSGGDEFAESVVLSLAATDVEGVAFDPEICEFSWTPSEDQGPGTYQFTLRATDEQYSIADTETFWVTVEEHDLAPVLASIDDLQCRRGYAATTTITAVDPDEPPGVLTFSLDPGDAHGAVIDPDTGEFIWAIPWWQPKGKYDLSVTVGDDSAVPCENTATFSVIVNELGDELVMMPIMNFIVPQETPVGFQTALRRRGPATGVVSYELVATSPDGAIPDGAAIDADGRFSWTPGEGTGGRTFEFTVVARDQSEPLLETSESFLVLVQMPPMAASAGMSTPACVSTPELHDLAVAEIASQDGRKLDLAWWANPGLNSTTGRKTESPPSVNRFLFFALYYC